MTTYLWRTISSVALTALLPCVCAVAADAPPTGAIWTRADDASVSPIRNALSDAGYATGGIDADGLAAALSAATGPDLLVLPDAGAYPAAASAALVAFMEGGGGLVVFGGAPLTQALAQVDGEWVPVAAGTSKAVPLALDEPWTEGHAQAGVDLSMRPGPGDRAARFVAKDFRGYAYRGMRVPELPFTDAAVAFEARDAGGMPRVCVEITAADGSRWKTIATLDTGWCEYRIHLADFVSYNTPERAAGGDYCRPGEVRTLAFGMTANMVGTGSRVFEVRNLRFEEAAVPSARLRTLPRFKDPLCSVRRWFGEPVGAEEYIPAPFAASRSMRGTAIHAPRSVATPYAREREEGRWAVVPVPRPSISSGGHKIQHRFSETPRALTKPLLTARDAAGASYCAGRFSAFLDGPMAGGRHVVFGIPVDALDASPLLRQAVQHGLDLARTGVLMANVEPEFTAGGEGPVLSVRTDLIVPPTCPHPVEIAAAFRRNGEMLQSEWTPVAPGAELQRVDLPVSAPVVSDTRPYTLKVSVRGVPEHSVVGDLGFALDPLDTFRGICDFLRDYAETHGQLHGNRFIDSRGMRALLAAYDLFGDESYRDAALRWVDAKVVAEQREDGGYRMGYGIGKRGEECYVADGGEIAVCVAQAACYASGSRRETYLASLDRYMAYRESFRVETGGIGVGWCLQDYGQRPIVPLQTPTRIFAPEKNTYTIGCTLAATYAHARLRDDATLEDRAAKDADWLMERAQSLNGAYIESYLYAHAMAQDPARKVAYAEFMRKTFHDKMVANAGNDWWLTGGGRTALNLGGLAYWRHAIDPDDVEIRVAIQRAVSRMFSPDSAQSIPALIASGETLGHDDWIYICFGTLSLADALQPMVTMSRLPGMRPVNGP
ncbi:MAG: hypothetical protein GY851_04665 [bacterium]|nr:hypothetical protein [bacterium]